MNPDMIFCDGAGCPLRRDCQRARLVAHGRRASFSQPPFVPATGQCPYFLSVALLWPKPARIRRRAYDLWRSEGQPEGRADEHWHRAERELRAEVMAGLRPLDDAGGET